MSQHSEIDGAALMDSKWRRGRKDDLLVVSSAIADNFPLAVTMPPTIALFAAAARDVLMPADADSKGLRLTIINLSVTAAAVITLKTSADAALTPAVTVPINGAVTMIHLGGTGTTGWRRTDN
jgi:hypothetical protein